MTNQPLLLFICFLFFACQSSPPRQKQPSTNVTTFESRIFLKSLADTLSISVQLPDGYIEKSKDRYPVVYLLDANLYYDIMASILRKYSSVGLSPQVILVGIGYKDFATMDSLRSRDYTYPAAIPEYEMSTSGGGARFLAALTKELKPHIDSTFRTKVSRQVLAGHSLGGYFAAYALLQNLCGSDSSFYGYIAASPSMHYNRYYLLNQFEKAPSLRAHSGQVRAYFTFGGLEESGDTDSSIIKQRVVSQHLRTKLEAARPGVVFRSEVYSNLDHMDTQLPTFIKGLQWILGEE